ncbi:MAG: hypothetical protein ABJ370_16185 [Paracoccaceae bacterium]
MRDFFAFRKFLRKIRIRPASITLADDVTDIRERRLFLSDWPYEMVVCEFEDHIRFCDLSELLEDFENGFLNKGEVEWDGNVVVFEFDKKNRTVTVCDMFCEFDDETLPWDEFKKIILKSKTLKDAKKN